jgi:hypothetical protein
MPDAGENGFSHIWEDATSRSISWVAHSAGGVKVVVNAATAREFEVLNVKTVVVIVAIPYVKSWK